MIESLVHTGIGAQLAATRYPFFHPHALVLSLEGVGYVISELSWVDPSGKTGFEIRVFDVLFGNILWLGSDAQCAKPDAGCK